MTQRTQEANVQAATAPAQYLTFMLGGESFGIGIMAVKEIIGFGNITDVPMMPDSIRGVINLRGAVVPVMDLAARFGRPQAVPGKRTCIVIVELETEGERQVTGVIVDAVSAVLDIPASEIEPAPSFGTRIRGDFIAGMGKLNGKFVILLNVEQVLKLDGLPELASAEPAAA
jgi:purine-binding chemotaxis protein CheW